MAASKTTFDTVAAKRFTDAAQEPNEMLAPITGYAKMPLVPLEMAIEPLVAFLPAVQSHAYVAKLRCKNPTDSLTQDESASIMLYTMGWEPMDQCLYTVLNAALRSKQRNLLKPWFLYLKLFLTALNRLPSTRAILFRGIKMDLRKEYQKGNTIVWWGFSSCTQSVEVLQSELFLGATGARTIFTIECESAKDIGNHSYYRTEDEMILSAATSFRVISCLNQGNGLSIIQLKEVQAPFPLLEPVVLSGMQAEVQISTHATTHAAESSTVIAKPSLGPPNKHIMLSYEPANDRVVEETYTILTAAGWKVWMDIFNLGEHEEESSSEAVEKAWLVICFPTPAYQLSKVCRDELCYARKAEKKIIPIMTKSNWHPSSWLGMALASTPCIKWENIQATDVATKMPALLQRLEALASGDFSGQRQAVTRNYGTKS